MCDGHPGVRAGGGSGRGWGTGSGGGLAQRGGEVGWEPVCADTCMYVHCVCVRMHSYASTCVRGCAHTSMHTCTYVHVHVCIRGCVHICTSVHVHAWTCGGDGGSVGNRDSRILPLHPKVLEASLRSGCLKIGENSGSIRTREHFTHIFGSRKRHSSTPYSFPLLLSLALWWGTDSTWTSGPRRASGTRPVPRRGNSSVQHKS